jgi:hypothetical protein
LAFAYFLQEHHTQLYENLVNYFGLPEVYQDEPDEENDKLWADFENVLANLDSETVLDDNIDHLPNIASDNFRDGDWHAMAQVMESLVAEMTEELFSAFKQFILAVRFPPDVNDQKLYLNKKALFLTFNYTDTLERYYSIPPSQILYLHGNAKIPEDNLVLGHGIEPENFRPEPQEPPKGLTDEEYDEWIEQKNDQYDYSYESAKETLAGYFERSYKKTAEVIQANENFFQGLKRVCLVTVIGHSLSNVDSPYIEMVRNSVHMNARWSASFFGSVQRERIHRLEEFTIKRSNISVFEIQSLRDTPLNRVRLKWKYYAARLNSR